MTIEVLYEDNHCLAVNKPAGLLSQGDQTGDPDLVSWARGYLKDRYAKPGNVFVGLVHRLDRPTSGVVLLARTSKAASRLSAQFRAGKIAKVYWAIVEGHPDPPEGQWVDVLDKDRGRNRSRVLDEPEAEREGQVARVAYRVVGCRRGYSKLELRPETGRSHQLRVQLKWVESEGLLEETIDEQLGVYDAILVPGGFGSRGTEGMISAIQYAREKNKPFLGLCFGFQLAVVEFARHVCGLEGANSTEICEETPYPVIDLLPEQN